MTRRLFAVFCVTVAVASESVAAEDHVYKPSAAEHAAMLRDLDRVFEWAGVRRLSDLRELECGESKSDGRCTAKVFLDIDGKRRRYNIELVGKPRRLKFAAF